MNSSLVLDSAPKKHLRFSLESLAVSDAESASFSEDEMKLDGRSVQSNPTGGEEWLNDNLMLCDKSTIYLSESSFKLGLKLIQQHMHGEVI